MCTTKLSPTAATGSPVALISIPELSIATCPCGSHSSRKIVAWSAAIVRWTSSRSLATSSSCHLVAAGDMVQRAQGGLVERDEASFDLRSVELRVPDEVGQAIADGEGRCGSPARCGPGDR